MTLTLGHVGWSVLLMPLQKSAAEGHRNCPQSLARQIKQLQWEGTANLAVKRPTTVLWRLTLNLFYLDVENHCWQSLIYFGPKVSSKSCRVQDLSTIVIPAAELKILSSKASAGEESREH